MASPSLLALTPPKLQDVKKSSRDSPNGPMFLDFQNELSAIGEQSLRLAHLKSGVSKIDHVCSITGVARASCQVERINQSIFAVIAKIFAEDPSKWLKYVPQVQKAINSQMNRSTKPSPFEMLFGTKMYTHSEILTKEFVSQFNVERNQLREEARKNF